jgi:ribulose-phosphate 3-epimerase
VLPKIESVRQRIDRSGKDIWLEVDGGVKADNARRIGNAGADTLVAGSAVFGGGKYAQAIEAIRAQALQGWQARTSGRGGT